MVDGVALVLLSCARSWPQIGTYEARQGGRAVGSQFLGQGGARERGIAVPHTERLKQSGLWVESSLLDRQVRPSLHQLSCKRVNGAGCKHG